MQLPLKQRNLYEESSPSFCAGRKLGDVEQALLWSLLQQEPRCPSRVLLDKAVEQHLVIAVSIRHINRWRAVRGLNRGKGRPGQADGYVPVACGAEVVRVTPRVSFVGVHVFAHWLDQHDAFGPVVAQLKQAADSHQQRHPDAVFALLRHRESTFLQRFQALFFAPLLGIERLSEFDTREHPLQTLIGRSYQSSTLRQFLGQLERVEAAESLMSVLIENDIGSILYVDGHMIAHWSRLAMHKGKITMLGRIMAGSQAVIAHDQSGQAVFVAYYAPDIHLSQVILAYCQKVSEVTGSIVFVIHRAVNSVALARAFEAHEMGLLCMLDDNEHQGLASFEATLVETLEDGTKVYSGAWKERRQEDPRHFVIVHPIEGKSLVYWGTPKVKEALEANEWPGAYRDRNEIQEHRFKDMIAHGALKINYGRKTLPGPTDIISARKKNLIAPLVGDLESLIQKRWEERQGDFIFHQGDGRPVGRIEHNWRTSCRKAGMPDKLFHDLRRSAVRVAIESGLSERHTMALCGHKTNHMLHRYHIVVERDLREAMLAMVRPKNVSPFRDLREPSSQLPENITRKRIGAGVPPGLQIQ